MSDEGFGELLNTVDRAPYPCPRRHEDERMRVFEDAVRWACGAVTPLPLLPEKVRALKPPAKPRTAGVLRMRRGTCPVCGRDVAIHWDGTVHAHGHADRSGDRRDRANNCPGTGQKPEAGA
ncbi:hypothetical protein [Amycolatopsis sp. CFH S0078]|uniref:hypothetical protein n=1 Tax=Amycolatopsis sp. CFH S0078 TaxID=1644108 RepID=UPI00106E10F0|nr:hypothetical protein [Amycolatopsis sp. CFH S0078]